MGGRGGSSGLSTNNKQYTYNELIRGLYYDKKEDPEMRKQWNKMIHKDEFDKAYSEVINELSEMKIDRYQRDITLQRLRSIEDTHEGSFYNMDYHVFIRKKANLLSGGNKLTYKALQQIYIKMSKLIKE